MPRVKPDAKLQSRSSRRAIRQSPKLHITKLFTGLALGYRKGKRGGTWIARRHEQGTQYSFQPLGVSDDVADADGIRVLSFDQAQEEARNWFKRKGEEDAGERVPGSYTVAAAIHDYVKNLEKTKRKPQGRTTAIADAHILPTLGRCELSKLSHSKVKAWRDSIAEAAPRVRTGKGKVQAFRTLDTTDPDAIRKRQATANRILTVLKAALNYAYEEKRITSKAAWEVVKPFRKVDVPRVRFLTVEEVTGLVAACSPDFQSLVKAALLPGARYGELTAMTVADFNAADGKVYIAESKNGESRYVDLNAQGVALFVALTQNRTATEPIFVRSNGAMWKSSEQKRPMDTACKAAQIEGVTFHILRHTYASHAVMNGMPIEVLAEVLGHKDTRITMRHYAHLCHSYKQKLVRANAPGFGFTGAPGPAVAPSHLPITSGRRKGRILSIASASRAS